jgi:hypothetical protein
MDNTMYVFDGETRAKSNLALAVITKYAQVKKPNLEQLQEVFGKHAVANATRAKALADTSGRRRHFLDEPLTLHGKQAFVSNQWRLDTIEKLIETARGLGMKITVAKEKQVPITEKKKSESKKVTEPTQPEPAEAPAKKRGRPKKEETAAPAKKRGRPKKA